MNYGVVMYIHKGSNHFPTVGYHYQVTEKCHGRILQDEFVIIKIIYHVAEQPILIVYPY